MFSKNLDYQNDSYKGEGSLEFLTVPPITVYHFFPYFGGFEACVTVLPPLVFP